MNKLTGVAVFLVALAVALLVTNYYRPRPDPPPPPPIKETPPTPPATRTKVTHRTQLVTLDVAARKSVTTLVVEQEPGSPAPDKLWVWTAFFVPGGAGGEVFAGDPVLVERPFEAGSRAKLNVTAACPWCGQRDAPAAGYYAQVNVSTASATDARLDDSEVSRDLTRSTPVTVEEGRGRSR